MKVTLVVASGVHQGRQIPIAGSQFLIGRDPQCQLRPASPAISKQHCGIYVRDGEVFAKDFGSTNGTFVNDTQLGTDAEVRVEPGAKLKVGPLEFTVQIEKPKATASDPTPLPEALKALDATSAAPGAKASAPAKPGSRPAVKPVESKPQPIPGPAASGDEDAAALLLGMSDDDPDPQPGDVPTGSTIMDAPVAAVAGADKKAGAVPTKEDTSNAASEILRKYMRRPR